MNIRPLNNDVLITPINYCDLFPSRLFVINPEERNNKINFFKVLAVSAKVTAVKIGDVILVEYGKHTPPVMMDGIRCAITAEKDISAVLYETEE